MERLDRRDERCGGRIRLTLLGRIELCDHGGRRIQSVLSQPKRIALLAYLAIEGRSRLVRRDELTAVFWPRRNDKRARKALRDALYFLRRSLGDDVILTPGDEVGLDWDRIECDACESAETLDGTVLGQGGESRRGEFLAGFHISGAPAFEKWVDKKRAQFRAADSGEEFEPPVRVEAGRSSAAKTRGFLPLMATLTLLALVVGAGWWWLRSGSNTPAPTEGERIPIAVLPLESISSDPEDRIFTDGIHAEILSQLFKISGLRVTSRTSTLPFRERSASTGQIAQTLGVRYLVEGSVRRAGETVRITAQLIDPDQDEALWSEAYDDAYTAANLFEIQTAIARQIADELRVSLLPEDLDRLAELPTTNTEAYEHYLRARTEHAWTGNRSFDIPIARAAIDELDLALELDPNFGLAAAWSSLNHTLLAFLEPTENSRLAARAAADLAFGSSADLLEVRVAKAFYHSTIEQDHQPLDTLLSPLLGQLPTEGGMLVLIAHLQGQSGAFDAALEILEYARGVDPMNALVHFRLSFLYGLWHMWDEANAAAQMAAALSEEYRALPSFHRVFTALVRDGNAGYAEAVLTDSVPWSSDVAYNQAAQPYEFPVRLMRFLPRQLQLAMTRALVSQLQQVLPDWDENHPRILHDRATVAKLSGDTGGARRLWEAAVAAPTAIYPGLIALAHLELGNETEAIEHARRGADANAGDAFEHPWGRLLEARIYAHFGHEDQALRILEEQLPLPSWISPAILRIDPIWEPLWDNPEFEALLARSEDN